MGPLINIEKETTVANQMTLVLVHADGTQSVQQWRHVLAVPNDAYLAMREHLGLPKWSRVVSAILVDGTDTYRYTESEVVELAGRAKPRR